VRLVDQENSVTFSVTHSQKNVPKSRDSPMDPMAAALTATEFSGLNLWNQMNWNGAKFQPYTPKKERVFFST
jgi:hypothetical protein